MLSAPDRRRLLLIGWDAADWQVIHPLVDAGLMPTLEGIINTGTIGNLASLSPMLSPILWTSIATGKRCYTHGVTGFAEPLPDRSGIRPVGTRSRRCKALWNIRFAVGSAQRCLRVAGKSSGRTDSRRDGLESFLRAAGELHA